MHIHCSNHGYVVIDDEDSDWIMMTVLCCIVIVHDQPVCDLKINPLQLNLDVSLFPHQSGDHPIHLACFSTGSDSDVVQSVCCRLFCVSLPADHRPRDLIDSG